MRIVIDPGHGGQQDTGKSTARGVAGSGGTLEKDITLGVAQHVLEHLGGQAVLTRQSDHNLSLGTRASRGAEAEVFVSLHADWGRRTDGGPEAFAHRHAGPGSLGLARELRNMLGAQGTSTPQGDLAVLHPARLGRRTAATMIELGDLSRPEIEARLADPHEQARLGGVIASGILAWQQRNEGQLRYGLRTPYAVPLIPQPDKLSCWAGAMAMLVSHRRQQSISAERLANEVGQSLRTSYGWDVIEAVKDHYGFQHISLPSNTSLYYAPQEWYDWLAHGPLWITTVGNPSHAIVLYGMEGELSESGARMLIQNPWDTRIRFSSDPLDFSPTNHGRTENVPFARFARDFVDMPLMNYGEWRVLYLPT